MYFDEHNPPHIHVEYQNSKAVFDFYGNILRGSLKSRTATRLIREWIDIHFKDLEEDWILAQAGKKVNKIEPLN